MYAQGKKHAGNCLQPSLMNGITVCHEWPNILFHRFNVAHFTISFPYAFHTRLSAKQFEAREEERLLSKETVEKARSFHRERSVVFRFDPRSFILRYPFRESIPRSALPLAISSRDREEEKEGNCWQNDSSNGSYGPLVRFNGISPSRAKIWVAGATRARARLWFRLPRGRSLRYSFPSRFNVSPTSCTITTESLQ